MKPSRLGHVHLNVSDLKRAERFYTQLLGFEIREKVDDNFVFLTLGEHHHDVALRNVGTGAPQPPQGSTGLYHVAFELSDMKEFAAAYQRLKEAGIALKAVDHGISKTMYFSDPDKNGIELYIDTREEREEWRGIGEVLPEEKILSYLGSDH